MSSPFDLIRKASLPFINQLLDPTSNTLLNPDPKPTKDDLFRAQFHLPLQENLKLDIPCEFLLPGSSAGHGTWTGKLSLSETFLAFVSSDRHSCSFTIPLFCVKKVERTNSRAYQFALSITIWNGLKLTLQFIGLRHHCDQFCEALKAGLKEHVAQGYGKGLKEFMNACWSNYLVERMARRKEGHTDDGERKMPPAGLGRYYRYPGDPIKYSPLGFWLIVGCERLLKCGCGGNIFVRMDMR
jgi:TBC1 domain family member 8/9